MNSALLTRRALALVLALHSTALAQNWTGGGDNVSWNQPANWSALPVSGPGVGLGFNNAAAIVTTQNLGNPFVLGALQANGPGGLTINGNALNFDNGANDAIIFGQTISPFTINAPVVITSNTQLHPGFAGAMTLAGGLSGVGELRVVSGINTLTGPGTWTGGTVVGYGSGQGTLRIGAANALSTSAVGISTFAFLEFNSATGFTVGNTIYGAGTIRQMGAGTVLLTGNNSSWNGPVEVTGGTLRAGSANALGGGNSQASILGGTLQLAINNALIPVQNSTNIGPLGTLDLAGFQQTSAVNVTNDGQILLPAGSLLAVGGTNSWTGSSSGAGALTFAGFATLNAGTNLQHTGGITQVSGQTQVTTSNALPNTGLLRVSGGFFNHSATETVDSVLVDGGTFGVTTFNVSNSMDLQSGGAAGNVTVTGPFTKTTGGSAGLNGGTFALNGGGTVAAGVLNVFNTTVNGAFDNSASGTTTISFGSTLNGPTTNSNILNVNGGGVIAGTVTNVGNLDLGTSGIVTANVNNSGLVSFSGTGAQVSGNITGGGQFFAASASGTLSGTNSYTGGSTLFGSLIAGDTDSIQGAWSLNALSTLDFNQNFNGTMAGNITGAGSVQLSGSGIITLSGNNNFTAGVLITGFNTQFGVGSNSAAGSGGLIQGSAFKMSAEGGPRTLANPFLFGNVVTEFTGANDLTLSNAAAKTISGTAAILHTSTGTTTVGGTFLGQNTTSIDVNAGQLVLGAAVNNGFRMDGTINVAAGATLEMISNSFVKLGPTNLNGGTLIAANGVAVPTGLALNASGNILGRVATEAGAVIEATGPLTLGDATNFNGFFSNGELREEAQGVTILDKNQAVLGGLTEVGTTSTPGLLTAANGVFVDFGRAITGYGIVAGTNALAQASIINGDAEGNSNIQPLDFTGYVKGLGTFTDVVFSGTFSPGLSPAIVPVEDVMFGPASTLLLEIGGLTPGAQHDQLDITGTLGLDGTLDVDLINGFNPVAGDTFNVFDGPTTGTFDTFLFPVLNPGLAWDTTDLYTQGDLKVVPEPSTAALLLLAAAAGAARRTTRPGRPLGR